MTITAKYPGRCATCGDRITPGQQIEWTKGGASRHSACASGTRAPRQSRRASGSRFYGRRQPGVAYASAPAVSRRLREPGEGEHIVHRDTTDYEVGQVLHATRIPGGGGEDGHYWTVVAASSHRIHEAEDDTREGERRYDAIIRPATADEAAAKAAAIAEATARKTRREEVARELRASYSVETIVEYAAQPAQAEALHSEHRMAGGESWWLGADGAIYYTRSDYDMGPTTWRTTASRELVAEAKALGLRPGLV